MIIHQSDEVSVRLAAADSDMLVVFVSAPGDRAADADLRGADTVRKAGVAAVWLNAPSPDAFAATDAGASMRATTARYRHIVVCGQDALPYARCIGAGSAMTYGMQPYGMLTVTFVDPGAPADDEAIAVAMPGSIPDALLASTPRFVALLDACRDRDAARVRALAMACRRRARNMAPAVVAAAPAFKPVVSVFGSCRVYNPCALLAAAGRITLNQSNIFGFVHCAAEVLQQFQIITGASLPPSRLRPYLNIGVQWPLPEPGGADALQTRFAATDVFVVEISSLRLLRFKAFLLQINRTRELLATEPHLLDDWWTPLLRTGVNNIQEAANPVAADVKTEIRQGLSVTEQPLAAIAREVEQIARRLGKPVLFVSHFNADMHGRPIAQRSTIVAALAAACLPAGSAVFDPTADVLAAGIGSALADTAHYQPAFEARIAGLLHGRIATLAAVRADTATSPVRRVRKKPR